jgi:hypothetical protein
MRAVTAAGALLLIVVILGMAAMASRPGSRVYRSATWGLTASVMVVAGTMISILLGVEVPWTAAFILVGCPVLVVIITTVHAHRLNHRLIAAKEDRDRIRRRY